MYVLQLHAQAKPFAVLPGSGMAIELVLKSVDKVCATVVMPLCVYACTVLPLSTTGHCVYIA